MVTRNIKAKCNSCHFVLEVDMKSWCRPGLQNRNLCKNLVAQKHINFYFLYPKSFAIKLLDCIWYSVSFWGCVNGFEWCLRLASLYIFFFYFNVSCFLHNTYRILKQYSGLYYHMIIVSCFCIFFFWKS